MPRSKHEREDSFEPTDIIRKSKEFFSLIQNAPISFDADVYFQKTNQ